MFPPDSMMVTVPPETAPSGLPLRTLVVLGALHLREPNR
jgi:hypothetical protein